MRIGFVGLGRMGGAMARNLCLGGHEVHVYNRTREKAEELTVDGAIVADSPAEACRRATAVFTMLADDTAVSDVVFGEHGIASGLERDSAHISSSTISTAFTQQLAQEHAKHGQGFISAPVFGRPEAAANKQLLLAIAGKADLILRCQPLFDAIGRRSFVVGDQPWQANLVKLCGNFMIAAMMEAFGESFATLRKGEINHHKFLEIMNELFASPVYKNYGQKIANEDFEPAGFTLKLGLKDIRQAVDAADDLQAPMPLASVLRDNFLSAMAHGQGHMDWSSLGKVMARNAGLP
jgi:3-hydroxyisobutyrate dehydrogenase-like beta-hydroxyacid dehydrogenase